MGNGFYAKLAAENVHKNRRLYIPQMLTGAGLIAVFYILLTICKDEELANVRGGSYLPTIMQLGIVIMAFLSVILILYTNSFLMKQRKREYGLYHVLGMEKKHVGRVMMFESLYASLISIAAGLVSGVILYKLCELFICRILDVNTILGFHYIVPKSLLLTGFLFAGLYLFTYVINRIQLARMNPVELLRSVQTGEKEPKVKWFILLVGLVTLGAGYYIALTTESPLRALILFFVAVGLIIIGTYFLFTAGSIALLKFLKKRSRFYYHPKHMTAVSGLLYRMKQNAVGLASICILATAVVVMISSTMSLYAGIEDTLNVNYPHDLSVNASFQTDEMIDTGAILQPVIKKAVKESAQKNGLNISYEGEQTYLEVLFGYRDGELTLDIYDNMAELSADKLAYCCFITEEEYTKLTGNRLELSEGQMACFSFSQNSFDIDDEIKIGDRSFNIRNRLPEYPVLMEHAFYSCFGMVVSDADFDDIFVKQKEVYGENASEIKHEVWFDFDNSKEKLGEADQYIQRDMGDAISAVIASRSDANGGCRYLYRSRPESEESLYGMYGSLLFLGLILGTVFLFATVLIIYYKQISEGYEDRSRFQIMRSIGMSRREVKSSIRSQILIVFFLPLAFAALHVTIAFPIIKRLLLVLELTQTDLFLMCTIGVFVVFAVIYVAIYSLTARTYYKIVS